MKKQLLFSLLSILFISFSACKKDKKKEKPIDQAIISTTWLTVNEKYEYFDAAGTKIYEVTNTPGVQYQFSAKTQTVGITDLNKHGSRIPYALSNSDGKNFVELSYPNDKQTFQVLDYTSKTMSWRREKSNVTFNNNGASQVAAKLVESIDFHCPCRE